MNLKSYELLVAVFALLCAACSSDSGSEFKQAGSPRQEEQPGVRFMVRLDGVADWQGPTDLPMWIRFFEAPTRRLRGSRRRLKGLPSDVLTGLGDGPYRCQLIPETEEYCVSGVFQFQVSSGRGSCEVDLRRAKALEVVFLYGGIALPGVTVLSLDFIEEEERSREFLRSMTWVDAREVASTTYDYAWHIPTVMSRSVTESGGVTQIRYNPSRSHAAFVLWLGGSGPSIVRRKVSDLSRGAVISVNL
jgi:hypothetical protein